MTKLFGCAQKVKLLIIDEVHLLNEDRGAVIETIVARTLRQVRFILGDTGTDKEADFAFRSNLHNRLFES